MPLLMFYCLVKLIHLPFGSSSLFLKIYKGKFDVPTFGYASPHTTKGSALANVLNLPMVTIPLILLHDPMCHTYLPTGVPGFLLPRRQKIASILGTALTLAIFCTLIQKCVILVDPAKYMDSSNATGINPGACQTFAKLSSLTEYVNCLYLKVCQIININSEIVVDQSTHIEHCS